MCKRTLQLIGYLVLLSLGSSARLAAQSPAVDWSAPEERLREYVEAALDAHPTIREAQARHKAVRARIPQATALPDPMLTFTQALRSAETRVGPQLNTIGVSQTFPWRGKRGLRGAVVEREAEAAAALVGVSERDIIVRVKKAYYELAYVDEAIRISREEQSLLEHYERLAQTRYATGQGLQQAVLRLQAEITKLMNRQFSLAQQRTSQVARLNALMDRSSGVAIPEVARQEAPGVRLDIDVLTRLGEDHRQEIQAADALIRRSEAAIDLAERNRRPNLTVGAGFVNVGRRDDMGPSDNGKNALTLSVGLNIPLRREKYDAAVEQAVQERLAQRSGRDNVLNEMRRSIHDLVTRLETLQQQQRLFEQVLIPQAREALNSTEAAYQTGQVGTVDLLDSERVLLDVRLLHERHDADYLMALADLERAIGRSLPGEDD